MHAVLFALLMVGSCTEGAPRFAPNTPGKTAVASKRERQTRPAKPNMDVTSRSASLKATLRR